MTDGRISHLASIRWRLHFLFPFSRNFFPLITRFIAFVPFFFSSTSQECHGLPFPACSEPSYHSFSLPSPSSDTSDRHQHASLFPFPPHSSFSFSVGLEGLFSSFLNRQRQTSSFLFFFLARGNLQFFSRLLSLFSVVPFFPLLLEAELSAFFLLHDGFNDRFFLIRIY